MNQSQPACYLTDSIMQRLFENPGKKFTALVQVASVDSQAVEGKSIFTAKLSNGVFFNNFILFPKIIPSFLESIKVYDVIEASLLKKDHESLVMLIFDFKLVYTDIPAIIGTPTEYKLGAQNRSGDNQIPEKYLPLALTEQMNKASNESVRNHNAVDRRADVQSENECKADDAYTSIADLEHYHRSVRIKGRVVKKTDLKLYKSRDGEDGCLFNIVIKDSAKAIQAAFFDKFAQKYYPLLVEGKIYSFNNAEIKQSTKHNTTDNKFELLITEHTSIRALKEDGTIGMFYFKFVKICEIESKPENELVDVMAIVEDPGEMKEIVLKNGSAKEKRLVHIRDDSGYSIDVTLWGSFAVETQLARGAIIVFQDAKVKNYNNGKTLTFFSNSKVITKVPDHPRYFELLAYKTSNKSLNESIKNLGQAGGIPNIKFVKIRQMQNECSSLDKSLEQFKLYFTVIAHLSNIKGSILYESCPNNDCSKKVKKNLLGSYDCDACQTKIDTPRTRFLASLTFADDTGAIALSAAGDDLCQYIFGKPPQEMKKVRDESEDAFKEFLNGSLFEEFRFRMVARKETVLHENQVQYYLIKIIPVMLSPELYFPTLLEDLDSPEAGF